jgi:ubiquitin-protein ligase
MELVEAFLKDSIANSENFTASQDASHPNAAIICVSGYYHFVLSLAEPFHFTRGEGCSSHSDAIKKILAEANGKRNGASPSIRDAIIALRDGYLKYTDALDEEAQEEEDGANGGANDDDDEAAAEEQDRQAEEMRREIERSKAAELERMTPEERHRKELVDNYLKELHESGQTKNSGMSHASTLRLLNDLARIRSTDKPGRGWSAEMQRESLKNWIVKITGFDKGSSLESDMNNWAKKHGREAAIVLEMTMHKEYPYRPPFIRVLRPQFVQYTGHVTLGGSVCMLPLTDEGWNPSFDIEAIIEMVRANICDKESKAKVQVDVNTDYSLHEAREAFQRLVSIHGWKHKFDAY